MKTHNNHIHSDSKKRRSFLTLLFTAGDVRRYTIKLAMNKYLLILIASFSSFSVHGHGGCKFHYHQMINYIQEGQIIVGPLDIAYTENINTSIVKAGGKSKAQVFGYINHVWVKLKNELNGGARLYSISSSKEHWDMPLSGAITGFLAVKDECVLLFMLTSIS